MQRRSPPNSPNNFQSIPMFLMPTQAAADDTDGAIETYKRAFELSPNSILLLRRYLALLNQKKDFPQARTVLQAALTRDPKNGPMKGELIRVEAEISGLEAGLAKARAFAADDPDNPFYDIVSAELYEKAGRRDDAISLLEKALAARPSRDDLVSALSGRYARNGDIGKAEAVLNIRLQAEPKDLPIRLGLASLYLQEKKYGDAIAEYMRIIADRPGDATALNNAAWLYQKKAIWRGRANWPNEPPPPLRARRASTIRWDGSCWPKVKPTRQ